ncbi:TPA: hypothetical protein HA265_08465 [Candidatus Woesearchaeota archaeon]|nr:hypothetical protein [Candidatus Woesearchaeota archaeon]
MNTPAHFFFNYIILFFIIPDAEKYIIPIAIFSMVLDLDHIPGVFRWLKLTKEQRKALTHEEVSATVRTVVQEPTGILVIEVLLASIYLFGAESVLIPIAMACLPMHWLLDFLTVHTRPLAPFDNRLVHLTLPVKGTFKDIDRPRLVVQTVLTGVLLALFLVVWL